VRGRSTRRRARVPATLDGHSSSSVRSAAGEPRRAGHDTNALHLKLSRCPMTACERSAARLRRGREREEEDTARLSVETGGGGQVGGAGGDELQQRAFGRPAVGDLLPTRSGAGAGEDGRHRRRRAGGHDDCHDQPAQQQLCVVRGGRAGPRTRTRTYLHCTRDCNLERRWMGARAVRCERLWGWEVNGGTARRGSREEGRQGDGVEGACGGELVE
jgi:hypothetical protein